jgi:uncharacterized protein (TIRG00374 family)
MKRLLSNHMTKVIIGLLLGIGLLILVSRFVDIGTSIGVVLRHLATPSGIMLAILSGATFLLAFSLRGLRWKLFLSSVSTVRASTAIRIYLVGIFISFLFSFSSGEVAKTLLLKRVAGIPVSRSLPTIAMDRSLDLLPALVLMIVVPMLGIKMDVRLWIVLGIVSGLLIVLASFFGLTVWKRRVAIAILHKITSLLPGVIGGRIEAFATGFVDSLLASISRPHIFLLALALTCLAVICDSLFALFAFWTIGLPITFGMVIFGYTLFNLFFILPTPPGQVGSNEAVGLLVFSGLLHLPANNVTAMFLFSHTWAALLMCSTALICLKTLGLRMLTTLKVQAEENKAEDTETVEVFSTHLKQHCNSSGRSAREH